MQASKHPLTKFIGKYFFYKFIHGIARSKSIAMPNKKSFTRICSFNRLGMYGYTNFFWQIIKHPHIMIACKKMNRRTTIGYLCYLAKQAYKAFWSSVFIFKPIIKQIAHQINFGSIVFN